MTKFYAVDVPGNTWLSEWRWHYPHQWIGLKHQVSCFNGSVYARKGADDPCWNVSSEGSSFADHYRDLRRALLLDSGEMAWDQVFAQLRDVAITEEQVELKHPSLYRVILLNDDYTPMDFVAWLIESVFHKSKEESIQLMLQIHHKSSAICGVYPYDVARTKTYQVKSLAQKHEHPLECLMEVEEGDGS